MADLATTPKQCSDPNLPGTRWRALCHSHAGVAAIEFAFIMPVFLFLLVGVVDLGMMLFQDYELDQAVAAGAEYAAVNPSEVGSAGATTLASSIAEAVESANGNGWANDVVVVNDGPTATVTNGGTPTVTGTYSSSCYCPTGSPPSWSWGSATTCGSNCSGGGSAGQFVTITATAVYNPLLAGFAFITSSTLRQSAVVETQ
jgi:Flp pilus assembly protein TadG